MSDALETFHIEVTLDRPSGGMWHCGPNPSWVTVTHLPTMTQARAYHRSQHKAREAAMACVQMMLADTLTEQDVCSYPDALSAAAERDAYTRGLRDGMAQAREEAMLALLDRSKS